MASINYYELKSYINDNNKLAEGKEVKVYYYKDKVIKIFHNDRKSSIPRVSDEGLIKLSELELNCFNTPIDIIYEDDKIIGYTEKFIKEQEIDFDLINFDLIKNDIIILSENGFCIEDLFYNYIFTDSKIVFIDLTSYSYLKINVEFIKKQCLKKNIVTMNNFLIGLLLFEAFRKDKSNEYTKIYLANEYRLEHCEDIFYGDFIKEKNKHK